MENGNSNSNGNKVSRKRHGESNRRQQPPLKRPRAERDDNLTIHVGDGKVDILPNPVPRLPQISPEYVDAVFTHPSMTAQANINPDMVNYDRLEFLGDAYLEVVASRLIFESYPTAHAGAMCRLRESAVKNETLCKYTIMYEFDKKLAIHDKAKDMTKTWTKIYGDVFEAYVAAVVLSDPVGGMSRLEKWLRELWKPILNKINVPDVDMVSKQELAKKIMHKDIKLNYVEERPVVLQKGQEIYFIGVYLDGWGWKNQHLGSGQGYSKSSAGQEAASNALKNHPLIDQIISKRNDFIQRRRQEVTDTAPVDKVQVDVAAV